MPETRTITLNMDADLKTKIAEVTGYEALHQAVGYLAGWNMTFGHVEITAHDTDLIELSAVYRDDPSGPIRYVIGALWQDNPDHKDHPTPADGRFTFHS
mgnify:CR=1 FL=1